MPTVVTKTIGATSSPVTPDYTTLQAWEDALPANLVTADEQHIGECLDQGTFTAGVLISGQTTDSTRNIILRCATGASFKDKAGVRTTALDFNTSNGVSIQQNDAYGPIIYLVSSNVTLDGIQVKNSATDGCVRSDSSTNVLDSCILEGGLFAVRSNATARNCLLIGRGARAWQDAGASSLAYGCTFIRRTNGGTVAFGNPYGGGTLKNCAVFNFTAFSTSTGSGFSATYCATDLSAPTGTGNIGSLTYADQFESTTNDFRAKSSGSLDLNGTPDSTNTPDDITGLTRHASTPTIGCWEVSSSAGTFTGTSSLTVSTATLAATATHEPEHTATSALTATNTTLASSATHEPEHFATSALTVNNTLLSASATHDDPDYTGSSSLTSTNTTLSASATHEPEHTATSVLTVNGTLLSASAEVDNPTYTGSSSLTASNAVLSAAGSNEPFSNATSSLTVSTTTLAASGLHEPEHFATSTLTVNTATLSASGQHEPEHFATSSLTVNTTTLAASATHDDPDYTATGSLSINHAILSAAGIFANDLFTANAALTVSDTTLAATATFVGVAYETRERIIINVPDTRLVLNIPETRLIVDLES